MIQDIEPYRFLNKYVPRKPESDSIMLCYGEREILMRKSPDGTIAYPTFAEVEKFDDTIYKSYVYLFCIDNKGFYLGKLEYMSFLSEYQLESTQICRYAMPKHMGFAGITGYQLDRWYKSRRFCGSCGQALIPDVKERMMRCTVCGQQEYPKIMPAVIVAVTDGSRLLMSKYANRTFKKYALLAGFTEIGESVEDTVRREVYEEVGIHVKNITYYKSQPWSFSDTLLLGFFAELDGDDTISLDYEELALAAWFERDSINVEEEDLSLTNEMIMRFKNGG